MAHRVPLAAVGLIKCTTLSPMPVPFSEVGSDTSKAPMLNVFGSVQPPAPGGAAPPGPGQMICAWTVVAMKLTARNVAKAAVEIKDPTRIRTFLFMRFLPECVFENQVFDLHLSRFGCATPRLKLRLWIFGTAVANAMAR